MHVQLETFRFLGVDIILWRLQSSTIDSRHLRETLHVSHGGVVAERLPTCVKGPRLKFRLAVPYSQVGVGFLTRPYWLTRPSKPALVLTCTFGGIPLGRVDRVSSIELTTPRMDTPQARRSCAR